MDKSELVESTKNELRAALDEAINNAERDYNLANDLVDEAWDEVREAYILDRAFLNSNISEAIEMAGDSQDLLKAKEEEYASVLEDFKETKIIYEALVEFKQALSDDKPEFEGDSTLMDFLAEGFLELKN